MVDDKLAASCEEVGERLVGSVGGGEGVGGCYGVDGEFAALLGEGGAGVGQVLFLLEEGGAGFTPGLGGCDLRGWLVLECCCGEPYDGSGVVRVLWFGCVRVVVGEQRIVLRCGMDVDGIRECN